MSRETLAAAEGRRDADLRRGEDWGIHLKIGSGKLEGLARSEGTGKQGFPITCRTDADKISLDRRMMPFIEPTRATQKAAGLQITTARASHFTLSVEPTCRCSKPTNPTES